MLKLEKGITIDDVFSNSNEVFDINYGNKSLIADAEDANTPNIDVDIENLENENDYLDDMVLEFDGGLTHEIQKNEENLYLTPQEKEELAKKDDKLVQYMAKRFVNTGIAEDELVGIAYEGYVKALNMYRKNKKTKFSTYACKCMGNEILCFLRKEKKWTENVTSMHAPIGVDKNGNALDLEKVLKEESSKALDEMVISKDIDALVIESLNVLNDTERIITMYRFGIGGVEEKTQKAIAEELGISQAYVSKLEKDCLLKIKKYIQEEDLKNGVLGKNSYFNY